MRIAPTTLAACCLAVLLAGPAAAEATPCRMAVQKGVLPEWARTGFSDSRPRLPHVLGANGEIVAVVFGYPLYSPPGKTRSNKILWVSHRPQQPLSTLWIRAQRMEGTKPVGAPVGRRVMGGPGPSIVDLPEAGCWRLALRWSGREDTLDLRYGPEG